jgi:hypothetical protein
LAGRNGSFVSVGQETAGKATKGAAEIRDGDRRETEQMSGTTSQQPSPAQDQALQKARELARAAREHEAAERAQELEQDQELEQEGPER